MFMGFLSDMYTQAYGPYSLRYAILTVLGFYLLAALLCVLASRTVIKDWYRVEPVLA
jgi:hypothetical protein